MTTPRELEPQIIAAKLRDFLGQIEESSPLTNCIKTLAQLTESVTVKQEGVYKNVTGFNNKHEKEISNVLDSGFKKAEENKEQVKEKLTDGAKQFQRSAPEDTQQRYPQMTSPTSSSQR